jgi:uncharacterized membrane protein
MWLSAGLLLSGMLIETFSPGENLPPKLDLASFLNEMVHGRFMSGKGLLYAGVVTLIFTPVLRVCTAIVAFLAERDWNFVGISIAVLVALLLEVSYFLQ